MHACMCVSVHACMCVGVCRPTCVCICIGLHVRLYVLYVSMCACMPVSMNMYQSSCLSTDGSIHPYRCTYAHMHKCTYAHTHRHTCTKGYPGTVNGGSPVIHRQPCGTAERVARLWRGKPSPSSPAGGKRAARNTRSRALLEGRHHAELHLQARSHLGNT